MTAVERAGAPPDPCTLLACEVAVLRALEVAGKRGRTRQHRGVLAAVPVHEIHTHLHLAATEADCDRLLTGAWEHLQLVLPGQDRIVTAVDWYVRQLIVARRPHRRTELAAVLAVACESA